jgi:hypothetical protein
MEIKKEKQNCFSFLLVFHSKTRRNSFYLFIIFSKLLLHTFFFSKKALTSWEFFPLSLDVIIKREREREGFELVRKRGKCYRHIALSSSRSPISRRHLVTNEKHAFAAVNITIHYVERRKAQIVIIFC